MVLVTSITKRLCIRVICSMCLDLRLFEGVTGPMLLKEVPLVQQLDKQLENHFIL